MNTFEKLQSRYEFSGTLILKESMHIGSGQGDSRADSTFVKSRSKPDKEPIMFIPGSSLRGALRNTVERIVATLGKSSCLLSPDPHGNCVTANPDLLKNAKDDFEKNPKNRNKNWSEQDELNFLKDHLCDTCKLFGSTHFASRVKITDLFPENGYEVREGVVRFGVGIDRDTETASEGKLFEVEVLERKHKFSFEMIVDNVNDRDLGLLGIGLLEMLNGHFHIGAKSAAGLGKCQLDENNLKVKYFVDTTELKKYLTAGDYPNTISAKEAKVWITAKVNHYLGN